jgi:hypothetical protein
MKRSSGAMFDIRASRTPDKRSFNSESATPGTAWEFNTGITPAESGQNGQVVSA